MPDSSLSTPCQNKGQVRLPHSGVRKQAEPTAHCSRPSIHSAQKETQALSKQKGENNQNPDAKDKAESADRYTPMSIPRKPAWSTQRVTRGPVSKQNKTQPDPKKTAENELISN